MKFKLYLVHYICIILTQISVLYHHSFLSTHVNKYCVWRANVLTGLHAELYMVLHSFSVCLCFCTLWFLCNNWLIITTTTTTTMIMLNCVCRVCVCDQVSACSGDVANGRFHSECSRAVGTACPFTCNRGYGPVTKDPVVCQHNLQWSRSPDMLCKGLTPSIHCTYCRPMFLL